MDLRRIFNWLTILTVAVGLAAVPVIAKPHQAAAADGGAHIMDDAADDMHAMADGMPCCPDEGKPVKDCDSCPLMALCSMTIAVPAPSNIAALAPGEAGQTVFAFPDDPLIAGLGARPPDHPPRTVV